ncbi:class I SAM-dependent methyltransferase [Aquimarina aquimarini]|uniref:class I SAM-dependent methyltransferase n=1 Tax=Aquimarina aquimarini TaxID=1191734 RepID=UPI000D54C304|nr:class I SAM-dependent methyltransferase [Aquimarina aquimarini]
MASIGEDITRKLIESSGIKNGMKVLDLGCGNGNVTFLLADYIGQDGLIVGIDSNENAINEAKLKSKKLGLSNIFFHLGNLDQDFKLGYSGFDAVIVRRVLMYLPNPKKTIQTTLNYLKPKGLFLAQENDLSLTPIGLKSMPEHIKIISLIKKTLEKENVNLKMGLELNTILTDVGLSVEKVWVETAISTPNQPTPWAYLGKMMKDRMLEQKVINDVSEIGLETLEKRLSEERVINQSTFITDLVFCGIGRKITS